MPTNSSRISRRTVLHAASAAALTVLLPIPALGRAESLPERRLSHSDAVVMGLYARDQNLRLFRREIVDLVASSVGVEPGIDAGWHRQWVQRYVEDYLLQFGCLPDGLRRVVIFWGGYRDLGTINFGNPKQIAMPRLVPSRSWDKYEPQEKERFLKLLPFQRQIDVVAAGIPDQHLKYGFGWHRFRAHRYIGDHVLSTCTLPRGKNSFATQWAGSYRSSSTFVPIEELIQRWPIYDLEHEESLWHPERLRKV